ncbi:hypothetical protein Mapa_005343 [Marchantia paleacea]|nr:hypothetical protein Mapa_005343 [Marchantia paleacea]
MAPMFMGMIRKACVIPAHMRLPPPNERIRKSLIPKSRDLSPRHLSGFHTSGFFHTFGSQLMP